VGVYQVDLTVPSTATELEPAEVSFWVLGNYITHVEIIFPPGCNRVTKVALFYGIRKIYPSEQDQWFSGNNETFKFDTLDPLPDAMTKLRFVGWNDGGRYDHTISLRIVTKWDWEIRERVWLKSLLDRMELLLRRIGVI